MTALVCTCDQHGDYCLAHPNCACGCPKHAHSFDEAAIGDACITGSMNCHGCVSYRPAKLSLFHELGDDQLEQVTLEGLREEYKAFRAHHIEETTALWRKLELARTKP
jgi:hypothetical protein